MRTTIDRAGRVVLPKAMRDELGLTDGGDVDIELDDGRVTITPPTAHHHLEDREGRPVIVYDEPVPPLTDDVARAVVDHVRDR